MRCGWDSLFKHDDLVRSDTREYFSKPMVVNHGSVRARVKSQAHSGAGYRHVVIVAQLQFTGVREYQSDYRHYIGYPATIAVHAKQLAGSRSVQRRNRSQPGVQRPETIWLIAPCYTRINARTRTKNGRRSTSRADEVT